MTDATGDRATSYTASAESSSRNPQDWGRAVAIIFESLAEQARDAGVGPVETNMLGAEVHLRISSIPDGVTIEGTWTTVHHERGE
jgi:hypothetical protein